MHRDTKNIGGEAPALAFTQSLNKKNQQEKYLLVRAKRNIQRRQRFATVRILKRSLKILTVAEPLPRRIYLLDKFS